MKNFLLILIFLSTAIIFAQEKKSQDNEFKFHGQTFFNYLYTENSQGFNDENNRFYFGFKKKLNETFSTRFTLDVEKHKLGSKYYAYMKYGYLKAKIDEKMTLTMGVFLNPLHGFANKFWGHRYIISAYGGKYWNAVPQGLMFDYKLNDMIKLSFLLTNGSTYKYVGDNDKNKDLAVYSHITPLEGLDIVWHARYIIPVEDNAGSKNFYTSLFLGYSTDMFKIGYQALFHKSQAGKDADTVDSLGNVVHLRYLATENYEIFASFFINNEDLDNSEEDSHMQLIIGPEYKYSKNIKFALSYENSWTGSNFSDGFYKIRISSYVNF